MGQPSSEGRRRWRFRGNKRARKPGPSALPEPCSSRSPSPLTSQVAYTERYENKQDQGSSINLIRCSYLGSGDTSPTTSEEQIPYTVSSTSQRNIGNFEDTEKAWLPNNPPRNSPLPPPENSESLGQSRSRSAIMPYSDTSVQINTHTIILDFSMVHYVDNRALVILRQVSTQEAWP